MTTSAVNFIHDHPILGFLSAVAFAITGHQIGSDIDLGYDSLQVVNNISWEFPNWVIQLFQMFAYSGAGITGMVAFHKWFQKIYSKQSKKEKKDDYR